MVRCCAKQIHPKPNIQHPPLDDSVFKSSRSCNVFKLHFHTIVRYYTDKATVVMLNPFPKKPKLRVPYCFISLVCRIHCTKSKRCDTNHSFPVLGAACILGRKKIANHRDATAIWSIKSRKQHCFLLLT